MADKPKVAIIYYSATGTLYELAKSVKAGAEAAGAEVRLLKVAELAPEAAMDSNEPWLAHTTAPRDVPTAYADDVLWAAAVIFGSPTRFGNVSSQPIHDTLCSLYARVLQAYKVFSGLTVNDSLCRGQESTLLALYNTVRVLVDVLATPGYTDPVKYADGDPYGTSHVNGQGAI